MKHVGEPLMRVENLSKYFTISRQEILKAVDQVSFDIYRGETVGLVGESGCGKSTTGRCLVRLYEPTQGRIFYDGKLVSGGQQGKILLTKEEQAEFCKNVQMIFQNPYSSLNPRMTVKDIVGEGIRMYEKVSAAEADEKVIQLLEKVGLGKEHMSRFPHEFSGGQRQRIGIARALAVDPQFIVCDEPISALDVSIQAQVLNMLRNLQEEMGLTYLFIAHDLSVVRYISDRVVVMYLGTVVEEADSDTLYHEPLHPYTKVLLSSIPVADPVKAKENRWIAVSGEIPSPINPRNCCRFAERCPYAMQVCREEMPKLKRMGEGHKVACHLYL